MADVRYDVEGETQPLIPQRMATQGVRRRQTVKPEVAGDIGGTLGGLFSKKPQAVPRTSTREHSWAYRLLDPKSTTKSAEIYKWTITFLVLLNLVVFVFQTDDDIEAEWHGFFYFVEAFTSVVFLADYIARMITVTEHKAYSDPVWGRIRYALTPMAVVDAVSTFPFFIELIFGTSLPTTTPLRLFRLTRILKTESVADAASSVWRVIVYNSEILTMAALVAFVLIVITSAALYYLQPHNKGNEQFSSIPATVYMAVLMLTGQGGPEGELPWYTKVMIMITAVFSVAMFAFPASMLTWGFEAEALRVAKRRKDKEVRDAKVALGELPPEEESSESDTDFGVWFFRGAERDEEWQEYEDLLLGEEEGEAPPPSMADVMLPSSVEEFEKLSKAKKALLNLDLDNATDEQIEDIKNVAREFKGTAPVETKATPDPEISNLRDEVTQLRQEISSLSQLREEISSLKTLIVDMSSKLEVTEVIDESQEV